MRLCSQQIERTHSWSWKTKTRFEQGHRSETQGPWIPFKEEKAILECSWRRLGYKTGSFDSRDRPHIQDHWRWGW